MLLDNETLADQVFTSPLSEVHYIIRTVFLENETLADHRVLRRSSSPLPIMDFFNSILCNYSYWIHYPLITYHPHPLRRSSHAPFHISSNNRNSCRSSRSKSKNDSKHSLMVNGSKKRSYKYRYSTNGLPRTENMTKRKTKRKTKGTLDHQ